MAGASNNGLTHRQEAFAHHVARGMPLGEAYRLAGYKASGNHVFENASKLAKMTKVLTKVDQVRTEIAEARMNALAATMIVTAQTVGSMLTDVFKNATKDKQHGAAATAAMGLAKLHGLLVDKTEDVTRRAARSPDAPLEIDVESWLTEQGVQIEHKPDLAKSPETQAAADHGAPLPAEPLDQGSEPPLDESRDESRDSPDDRPLTH